eukprot:10741431-Lingulodinium_polyedra.AAC.1
MRPAPQPTHVDHNVPLATTTHLYTIASRPRRDACQMLALGRLTRARLPRKLLPHVDIVLDVRTRRPT